jgi:hypothetical protein
MDRLAIWEGSLFLLVSLCVVLLPLLVFRSRRRVENRSVQPLDLNAFHAVMERDDEAFLREKLSRAEFFRLKRRRIRVIWKYLRCIAHNAATVTRSAASARHYSNEKLAEAAREVAGLAWQIRVQSLLAFAKLTLEYMFPAIRLTRHRS